MKAYILRTDTLISPFQDAPGQALVLNRSIGERQEETLRKLGLEPERIESTDQVRAKEYLLFPDYVYCSAKLLKAFLKAVRKHGECRRLALEANAQVEMALPMQDLDTLPPRAEGGPEVHAFDLFLVRDGGDPSLDRLRGLPPEVVPVFMKVFEVEPPFYLRVEKKNRIGLSGSYCMHVKHWTHVYLLNFNALTGLPFEWFPRKLLWFLWRVLTAFSLNPFNIMRRLVIQGKKCSIHPTARIEASVLGNNVSVGAGAVVRGSYLGDGVRISEGAKVFGSIVGDGSEVTWHSILNLSLLYPRACVGIPGLQTVFVGRETFVSSMAFVIDVKFQGGTIGVRHQGRTVNTRLTTLGPCFGHRVRIGAGVSINCGREIPNDTAIIQDQEPLLSRMPEPPAPPGIYTVKQGTLSPVGGPPPKAPAGGGH